jgi:hypothetical protein
MNTYTIKATTAEEFYVSFPAHAPKITGQPAYNDIRQLRTVIYRNAASIASARGGGQHGHLGMVMDNATYATLTPDAWVDPEVPAPEAAVPENATQFQIAAAHSAHNQKMKAHQEFVNLNNALTKIITESIEELYLKPFYRPYVGLTGRTTKDVIQLLLETYGYILPHELQRNQEQLNKPYDATSEPLQILIDRYEEARTFANDGKLPITDGILINAGIVTLKNTGVLERFIDQWTDKPANDRSTWLQFKEHFLPRVLEYQKGRQGQTNNMHTQFGFTAQTDPTIITAENTTVSTMSTNVLQDTINQAHHLAMAGIMESQQELVKQLAELKKQLADRHNAVTPVRTNPSRRNDNQTRRNTATAAGNKDPNGYCWTHGYNVAFGHTSAKCRNKATGHQDAATRTDIMGGSQDGLSRN